MIRFTNFIRSFLNLFMAENEESLEMVIGKLLKERNAAMCTAESCTGGEIAHLITSVPGSSAYYKGSVIAYANEVKTRIARCA